MTNKIQSLMRKDKQVTEVLTLYARISNYEHGEKNGFVPKDIEDYVQKRIRREKRRKGGKHAQAR